MDPSKPARVLEDQEVTSDGDIRHPKSSREIPDRNPSLGVEERLDPVAPLTGVDAAADHLPIPSVRPVMSWRWKNRYTTTAGRALIRDPAMSIGTGVMCEL